MPSLSKGWHLAPTGTALGKRSTSPRFGIRALARDEQAKTVLRRFVTDWVVPRWREIALSFVFTAGLAATTGGYPLIIKYSFDSLMKAQGGVLPWVLAAIILVTAARSTFLYLHSVMSARIVTRMTTDMQKAAFAHLIGSDFARLTRDTTGHLVSRLTNELAAIQGAVQASMIAFVRDLTSVIAVLVAMLHLDWMLTLIVIGIYPLAVLPMSSISRR